MQVGCDGNAARTSLRQNAAPLKENPAANGILHGRIIGPLR